MCGHTEAGFGVISSAFGVFPGWQYGSRAPFQFLCPSSSFSFPCVHGEGNVLVHALVYLFGGFRLFSNSSLKGQLMSVT